MRILITLPFFAALVACLDLSPVPEQGTARIEIQDNQFEDSSTLPIHDLVWLMPRVDGSVQVFPDVHASVELGGANRTEHVMFDRDQVGRISSSLAQRFGDQALPSELNRIRLAAMDGNQKRWGESSYLLGATAGADARVGVGGFGTDASASLQLGLAGSTVERRYIAAYDDGEGDDQRWLSARFGAAIGEPDVNAGLPRTLAEAAASLQPGECIQQRGAGTVGFNFGVGTRLLIEVPATEHVIGALADGALRVGLDSDRLDFQFCMMEDGQAVIEAGIGEATINSAHLAIGAGYGAHGVRHPSIKVGAQELDAAQVIDHALRTQLMRQMGNVLSAQVEAGTNDNRESLVRFRIDTHIDNPEIQTAVGQFFQGDLRLAQELARRGTRGIRTELDVNRQGSTTYGGFGIGIFGMSFFAQRLEQDSTFALATPGGALSGMADRLETSGGALFSKHGYARTVLSGVETPRGGVAEAHTNLYFSWRDADRYMERKKVLASTNGLLYGILGIETYAPIASTLEDVARMVQSICPDTDSESFEDCTIDVIHSPNVESLVNDATSRFEAAIDRRGAVNIEASEQAIARQAFDLAVAASRAHEYPAIWVGPATEINSDEWFSDDAIEEILSRSGADFAAAVAQLDPRADRRDLDGIAGAFERGRKDYQDLGTVAETTVPRAGQIGYDAIVTRVPTTDGRPAYASADVETLARWRGQTLVGMIDNVIGEIGDIRLFNDRKERTFAFAMLGLAGSDLRNYRFDLSMRLRGDGHYRAAGYVDTSEDATDALDGIDNDAHTVQHRGSAVVLFGESIGWDANGMARLADVDAE